VTLVFLSKGRVEGGKQYSSRVKEVMEGEVYTHDGVIEGHNNIFPR
jgi:hypothetical protein